MQTSTPLLPKKSKHLIIHTGGMSLLEVLAGLAISMIVTFSFLYAINFFNKGVSGANKNDHLENAMLHVTAAFGSDDLYCTAILGGLSLSVDQSEGPAVPTIDYYHITGTKISNVLTIGTPAEKNPELEVTDMRLRPQTISGPDVIIANLDITFTKKSNFLGAAVTTRSIPVYAVVSAGKVKTCSTNPGGLVTIRRALCTIQSDGFAEYNVAKDECEDDPKIVWVAGLTPHSAKCGPGLKPAVSPKNLFPEKVICQVDQIPSTFNPPPREYSNGIIDDVVPPGASNKRVDKNPPTECLFAYEQGVDLTNVKAKIKCVPSL